MLFTISKVNRVLFTTRIHVGAKYRFVFLSEEPGWMQYKVCRALRGKAHASEGLRQLPVRMGVSPQEFTIRKIAIHI
jgi:hypothetical protein